MRHDWGYRLLGLCSVLFGGVTIAAREFGGMPFGHGLFGGIVVWLAALAYIAGGLLVQFPRTMRIGSAMIGIVFVVSALVYLRAIAAQPGTFATWDGLFERLGVFSGALIVWARTGREDSRLLRGAMVLFGVCVVVYTLIQAVYLGPTAADVPKWIPPGQYFWAILTTVAFAMAALAILTGYLATLATELLTLMILIFGITIWVPAVWTHPRSLNDWSEFGWNFAIAAAAWVLADWLRSRKQAA